MTAAPTCQTCGERFERKQRGRKAYHCLSCRPVLKRQKDRERRAAQRAGEWFATAVPSADPAELATNAADVFQLMEDTGRGFNFMGHLQDAISPYGPDVGRTNGKQVGLTLDGRLRTSWREFDARQRAAAEHPWWSDNPDWAYRLDEPLAPGAKGFALKVA